MAQYAAGGELDAVWDAWMGGRMGHIVRFGLRVWGFCIAIYALKQQLCLQKRQHGGVEHVEQGVAAQNL